MEIENDTESLCCPTSTFALPADYPAHLNPVQTTKDQVEVVERAIEIAKRMRTGARETTGEDVVRAIFAIRGLAMIGLFDDMPDFASYQEFDRHATAYYDSLAELGEIIPQAIRKRFNPTWWNLKQLHGQTC